MAPSKNTDREAREARDRLRRYNARQAVHTHQPGAGFATTCSGSFGFLVVATLATFTQIYDFSAGPGNRTGRVRFRQSSDSNSRSRAERR